MLESRTTYWRLDLLGWGRGCFISPQVTCSAACCSHPWVSLGLEDNWGSREILFILWIHNIYKSTAGSNQESCWWISCSLFCFTVGKKSEMTWMYPYVQSLGLLLLLSHSTHSQSDFYPPSASPRCQPYSHDPLEEGVSKQHICLWDDSTARASPSTLMYLCGAHGCFDLPLVWHLPLSSDLSHALLQCHSKGFVLLGGC